MKETIEARLLKGVCRARCSHASCRIEKEAAKEIAELRKTIERGSYILISSEIVDTLRLALKDIATKKADPVTVAKKTLAEIEKKARPFVVGRKRK